MPQPPAPLTRVRFFTGQLLTATDLQQEQDYHLARYRRHNRFLHGWGIASGLDVSLDASNGAVTVEPGLAIDCAGNEIVLAECTRLSLVGLAGKQFVVIRFLEQAAAPSLAAGEATEFTRIQEGASLAIVEGHPAAGHRGIGPGTPGCGEAHALCLATLSQKGTRWRLAPSRGRRRA